jgi:hypothetical protein
MKRPIKPFLVELKRSRSDLGITKPPSAFRLQEMVSPDPRSLVSSRRHTAANALFEPAVPDTPVASPKAAAGQGRILPSLIAIAPPAGPVAGGADDPPARTKAVKRKSEKKTTIRTPKGGTSLELSASSNATRSPPSPVRVPGKPRPEKRAAVLIVEDTLRSPATAKPFGRIATQDSRTVLPSSSKNAELHDWAPGQRWKKRLRYLRPQ